MSTKTMFKWIRHAAVLTLICALPATAQTTKWVDQTGGSDANDGNTEATAYATLQFAIDNSTSGTALIRSVINVKDGTYGSVTASALCEGSPAAIIVSDLDYLTIQAVPGHEPVIKPSAGNNLSMTISGCDHLIVDNIDSDQTVAQFDNWHVCNSNDLTARNSTFEGGEDGIDFSTDLTTALIEMNTFQDINTGSGDEVLDFTDGSTTDVVIQANLFQNNYRQITISPPSLHTTSNIVIRCNYMDGTTSEEAVRLISAADVLVENNMILNSRQQGLYIDNGCSDIRVVHNTFFNNDQEAGPNGEIRTKVTTSDIVIMNNILYGNGSNPAFETTVLSLPSEDYNLVYNTSDGAFTFGSNTIVGSDPMFVSTTSGSEDLHIQPGSPAETVGTDLSVADDFDKEVRPRPAASDPDIGADEIGPFPEVCGDGIVNNFPHEDCDDGNSDNTDACLNTCANASCGDGFTWAGMEDCDDGNLVNTDACLDTCESASCGDGFGWSGQEQCDDGNNFDGDGCSADCRLQHCGDSILDPGEQCDDGNTANGDGCDATCHFEYLGAVPTVTEWGMAALVVLMGIGLGVMRFVSPRMTAK